jgi:DNA-directed RNA polymerase subunit RPC12/RpoP
MTDLDIRCPSCSYSPLEQGRYAAGTDMPRTREDVLDFYEVGGTDEGYLLCPKCSTEFDPNTGVLLDDSRLEEGPL